MRAFEFIKLSPTKNVTVLVTTPVPVEEQGRIAEALLHPENIGGEQVGFLMEKTDPSSDASLRMMGGEFCGNATMSMGAVLANRENIADGASRTYRIEISGADKPVPCRIIREDTSYIGTVDMPLPDAFDSIELTCGTKLHRFPAIRCPGITHVIVGAEISNEEILRRIRSWNAVVRAEALGIMRYDESEGRLTPFVYVPASNTVVAESCCGSGSAALGAWLAHSKDQSDSYSFIQPGGTLHVEVDCDRSFIQAIRITGRVHITAKGTAYTEE